MLFLLLIVLLPACVSNRYLAPVSTFRDRTQQTVATLSDFYASRNSFETDIYLQSVAADSNLQVLEFYKLGDPTPLGKPYFSESAIKARIDALNLVSVYASRLYDLANTSTPVSFQTKATTLGQNLSSLDKTFQKLQGASDATAGKYIGPVSNLIGTIGEMYLSHERDVLLTKAVNDGAPQVEIILSQVRDDLNNIFFPEISTGTRQSMATLISLYNQEDRKKLTYEQRMAQLSNIKTAQVAASAGAISPPSNLVDAMMNAHKALVQFARDPADRKPASFAAFNSALNEWATQIQNVATQVKLLIH